MEANGCAIGWYIPPSWAQGNSSRHLLAEDASVLDAAEHALDSVLRQQKFLDNSRIPLIVHQTWRTFDAQTWPGVIRESVEEWIEASVEDETTGMAWILWDDEGIDALMKKYEAEMYDEFLSLPYPVEKADMFRVVVLKWFGGVVGPIPPISNFATANKTSQYADVDARPLKHPKSWVYPSDLTPWTDTYSGATHTIYKPSPKYEVPDQAPVAYHELLGKDDTSASTFPQGSVSAIFGIEADNRPDPDSSYWRMGYRYPVQLTNWALAMSPLHPVATQFLATLRGNITQHREQLRGVDPLDLTGPPALTGAVRAVAEREDATLSWDALSARNGDADGGRGKIVAKDALILPITGFSPGRGWFQNMGSKGIEHPNARLRHAAAGSWKNMDVKVHYGKLCRQLFGMCRDWKKISE